LSLRSTWLWTNQQAITRNPKWYFSRFFHLKINSKNQATKFGYVEDVMMILLFIFWPMKVVECIWPHKLTYKLCQGWSSHFCKMCVEKNVDIGIKKITYICVAYINHMHILFLNFKRDTWHVCKFFFLISTN